MFFVHFVLIISNLLISKKTKIFLKIETNLKQDIIHKNKSLERILFLLFAKTFIRLSDRVICSSRELYKDTKEKYFKNSANKLFLNYNPIIKSLHTPQFNYEPGHKFFNGESKVFIAVGRLNTEKGFIELVELFSKIILENNLTDTKLLIIGEGNLYKSLVETIDAFSMHEFIDIIEFNDDFERYLFFSHAFICNSFYEGFNNNIVHALNMGLTVISRDCDFGPREILINKEYGLLVKNNKEMKEKILLQNEKDKIFNKSAFKRSLDFSVKSSSQNFLNIIDEC
jgi:glycosyltransferase involved in cell wall biosynthesis